MLPRQMYVIQGMSGPVRKLKINNPDILTLGCALLERMYYCKVDGAFVAPPQPSYHTVRKTLSKFRGKVLGLYGSTPTPVSPEEFVQMYKGRKKTIYTNALTDLNNRGVCRKDAESIAFVKCEKVPEGKAPRCIQPRTPVYNISLGVFIKPIEHKLYRMITRVFRSSTPIVMKGFNVCEVAQHLHEKWTNLTDPVAVGLDAVKFDMHVSASMLKWEHSIYNGLYGSLDLKRLLKWQMNNRGRGFAEDGKLKYSVRGRRFSGDMNTALGNCLIMCAMVYAYCDERGIRIEFANNGDDCVIMMERGDLARFTKNLDEWFMQLGFRMTVEKPVDIFERIEFCQMSPVLTGDGYKMCRHPDVAREKDSICLFDIRTMSARRKWMGAVGECGLAIASGMPIFQNMYLAYCRHGEKSKILESVGMQSGMLFLSRGLEAKAAAITQDARYSFYLAYGITPDEQIAIEMYYDNINLDNAEQTAVESLEEILTSPM